MIDFERFKDLFTAAIIEHFGEDNVECRVVNKNNESLDALIIGSGKVRQATYPIWVYRQFAEMRAEAPFATDEQVFNFVVSNAITSLETSRLPEATEAAEKFLDWNNVKDNITLRLVGKQGNDDFLVDKYTRTVAGNLAAIYEASVDEGQETAQVTLSLRKVWKDVSDENIFKAAVKNTTAEAQVVPMNDILSRLFGTEESPVPEETPFPMFILTNRSEYRGNGSVLCPDVMNQVTSATGTDELMIIPSSVHEFIAIPMAVKSPEEVLDLVEDINNMSGDLKAGEVVSNSVYKYTPDGGLELLIA